VPTRLNGNRTERPTRRAGERARRCTSVVVAWLGLAGTLGCSNAFHPPAIETTRVSGRVVEGGRPVRGGWIEFAPVDGTVGNMRAGPIGRDGRFIVHGAPVGLTRVGVEGSTVALPNWRFVFGPLGSTIRRRTTAGSCEVTIDLLDELARARAEGVR
jgi:hypothetical protein